MNGAVGVTTAAAAVRAYVCGWRIAIAVACTEGEGVAIMLDLYLYMVMYD